MVRRWLERGLSMWARRWWPLEIKQTLCLSLNHDHRWSTISRCGRREIWWTAGLDDFSGKGKFTVRAVERILTGSDGDGVFHRWGWVLFVWLVWRERRSDDLGWEGDGQFLFRIWYFYDLKGKKNGYSILVVYHLRKMDD